MRKVGVYLGLVEDADRFDDEYDDAEAFDEPAERRPVRAVRDEPSGQVTELAPRRRPVEDLDHRPRLLPAERHEHPRHHREVEVSRITTLHPRTYNEARVIGEHFRDGIPVIMNLSEMDDNDAKRLVDFAAGLVFAVHGSIERVTAKVFLLSPPNVSVAAEDKQRLAEGGFFNQS
jgi:cell division inhibitor SepF